MGLSSSSTKSTSTVDPSAAYKPYIDSAAGTLQSTYGQVAPIAQGISSTLQGQLPTLAAGIGSGASSLGAANNYNQFVLGGGLLGQNPLLQNVIDSTNADVANGVNSTFGSAGRTGSGAQTYALGRALAQNEGNLRYTDQNNQLTRMDQAAALSPQLMQAGLGSYLTAATDAVGIPQSAADQYAASVGGLTGHYTTQTGTQTTNPSLGLMLSQIAANGASAYKSAFGG